METQHAIGVSSPHPSASALATDPGETNNLAESNSERVEAMKALLANDIQRGRTTPGPDLQNDVEVVMIKGQPAPRKKKAPAKK